METGLNRVVLQERLLEHLRPILEPSEWVAMIPHLDQIWSTVLSQLEEDLLAYAQRDPASRGRAELILEAYTSFKAVLFYRFAHQVWLCDGVAGNEATAHKLANAGKLQSGVEIHPAACIGKRFVLDHGYGTVIGETCEIGDDCYLLGGVTLGAVGIADNRSGKRHPTLGNRVEVGAGSRILGAVNVGDNVFISPACVVTRDVPANCRVGIVNQLQIERTGDSTDHRYIGAFVSDGYVHLVGDLPHSSELVVLDADHRPLDGLSIQRVARESHHQQYQLCPRDLAHGALRYPMNLRLSCSGRDITLLDPPGLTRLVRSVMDPVAMIPEV